MHDEIYETLILRQATGERLSQQEAHQLQAHLKTCADCRALVEEWAQITQAAQRRAHKHAATLPPLPELAPQRMRANGTLPDDLDDMEYEPMTTIPLTQTYQPRRSGGRLGLLAAAVLVGLIALMFVWMNTDDEPPALFATSIAQEPTATPLPERAWVAIAREDIAAEAQLNPDNVEVRYTLIDEIDPDALTSTVSRAVITTRVIGNTAAQPITDGAFIQPEMVGEAFNVMGQRQQDILIEERPQTAYDVLTLDERLSDFRQLVDAHAPTRDLLQSGASVWVYAPTNEALNYDDLPSIDDLIADENRLEDVLDGYIMRPRDVLYADFGRGGAVIGAYPVAGDSMVQVVGCGYRATGDFCGDVQRVVEQPLTAVLDEARDITTPDGTVALPLWEDNIDYAASADDLRVGQAVRLYEGQQIHADDVVMMDVNLGSELSPLPSMLLAVDEAAYPALSRLVTDGVTFRIVIDDALRFPAGLVAVTLPADVRTDAPLTGETIMSIYAGETRIVEGAQFVTRFGSGDPERVSSFITLAMSPQDAQSVFDYIENGAQLQVEAVNGSIEGQLSGIIEVRIPRSALADPDLVVEPGTETVLTIETDGTDIPITGLSSEVPCDGIDPQFNFFCHNLDVLTSGTPSTIFVGEVVDIIAFDDEAITVGVSPLSGDLIRTVIEGGQKISIGFFLGGTLEGEGFSLAYPTDWVVKENDTNEDVIYLAAFAPSRRILDATGGTELLLEPGAWVVRFSLSDASFLTAGMHDEATVADILNWLQASVSRGEDTEVIDVVDSGDRGELVVETDDGAFIYHIIEVEDGVFAAFLGAARTQEIDALRSSLARVASTLRYESP